MTKLLSKIKNIIVTGLSAPLFVLFARLNFALITAVLIRINILCIQKCNRKNVPPINILILPKAGFAEDALSVLGPDQRFAVYSLCRQLVKAVFLGFLPKEIDDLNYSSDDSNIEDSKKRLRAFWERVLAYLDKMIKFDAVLTGNFSYASEQELAEACVKAGIKFIALHKECLKTPGLEVFYGKLYKERKSPFRGSKICVYNDIEKRIIISSGIAPAESIVITGMPRLDRIHHMVKQKTEIQGSLSSKEPVVLFFLFNSKTGLPIIVRKTAEQFEDIEESLERLSFDNLGKDCCMSLVKLALREPRIKVLIKTKGDFLSNRALIKYFGRGFKTPKNLEIISGGDPLPLLARSSVVCGFNSTALFEAIAMNKPIVVPKFHEALNPEVAPYIVDFEDTVQYADTQEQLIDMLKNAAVSDQNSKGTSEFDAAKQHVLEKWVGNSDGLAGHRVREVIEQVIGKKETLQTFQKESLNGNNI